MSTVEASPGKIEAIGEKPLSKSSVSGENATDNAKGEEVKTKKDKSHHWSKLFRPWKWKRKKKSEKFTKTAIDLERKISVRSSREDLIKRGVLTDFNGPPTIHEQPEDSPDSSADGHDSSGAFAPNKENKSALNSNHFGNSSKKEAMVPARSVQHPDVSQDPPAVTPPQPLSRSSRTLSQEIVNADLPKPKPVAAKRTVKNVSANGQSQNVAASKQNPPKPPPKPSKHGGPLGNNNTGSTVVDGHSSDPSTSNEVNFASKVDVIQDANKANVELNQQTSEEVYDSDSVVTTSCSQESDEDEDDGVAIGGLAAKVARRDTLALKLANRSDKNNLEHRNIISTPTKTEDERFAVERNLSRHLSQRPSKSELEERNILPHDTAEERLKEREKVKRQLTRKLSMRPTVKELYERKVLQWHEYVEVYEIQNYDRRGDKPWTRLTPADKASIRKELNDFKATEMEVHEASKKFTRFHKP